jgi:predicted acyltransferase (DUF342 family)
MKSILSLLFFTFIFSANAQTKTEQSKPQIGEVACGLCQFDMVGLDCELAIRIDKKTYYVDGTTIDAHGDAHAKDGFCQTIRKAEVVGEIVGDKFKVSSFNLVPITK